LAPFGVIATRYSSFLISFGTPTIIVVLLVDRSSPSSPRYERVAGAHHDRGRWQSSRKTERLLP
jgi:hypothetical protein